MFLLSLLYLQFYGVYYNHITNMTQLPRFPTFLTPVFLVNMVGGKGVSTTGFILLLMNTIHQKRKNTHQAGNCHFFNTIHTVNTR